MSSDRTVAEVEQTASDVLVSVLAVQRFSIEKAFELVPGLEAQGFLDFDAVAKWSRETVQERLNLAGFRRSEFFDDLFSRRVQEVAKGLGAEGIRGLLRLEARGDLAGLEKRLAGLWGVGPAVIWNYKVLRELGPASAPASK